jgi:hypothetical protein
MANYNVEIRKRTTTTYGDVYYPKTLPENIVGLLTGGKIDVSFMPAAVFDGIRFVGAIVPTTHDTTSELKAFMDTYITSNGGSYRGLFFICSTDTTITVDIGTYRDTHSGSPATSGTFIMQAGDWLINVGSSGNPDFVLVDNDHPLATTSTNGMMSAGDKTKLDGIANNANNYAHPTQTAISVDADGVEVIDVLTINTLGHVTNATKRTLPNATTSLAGVMSAGDKTKLDGIANNANNYSHPADGGSGFSIDNNEIETIDALVVNTAGHVTNVTKQTIRNSTTSLAGLMSATDKTKLDGIANNANNYSHPAYSAIGNLSLSAVETMANFTVDATGHVTAGSKQSIRAATTTLTGIARLATTAEAKAGTDNTVLITPNSAKAAIDFFSTLPIFADLTTANASAAASGFADGSLALVIVT